MKTYIVTDGIGNQIGSGDTLRDALEDAIDSTERELQTAIDEDDETFFRWSIEVKTPHPEPA